VPLVVICSYCRKVIREEPGGSTSDVRHGMCPECAEHFDKLWAGMPLGEYLDDLPVPILVVSAEGRIIAANTQMATLLGRSPGDLRGIHGGEAFACVFSKLPEGCGKTVHCRECTIRHAVAKVAETGVPLERIPAYLDTPSGRIDLRISVKQRAGLVKVVIEELKRTQPVPAKA
jgi:PAS domain-containing protein